MAEPTAANGQITDAITQADLTVLGDAPAVSLATIYQTLAQSTGLAMLNAVHQQQQAWTIQSAVTAKIVRQLLDGADPVAGDDLLDDLLAGVGEPADLETTDE